MTLAKATLTDPLLGKPFTGAPTGLGFDGVLPGDGAPPVVAEATPPVESRVAANATTSFATNPCRNLELPATGPLFPSPAELAVGLALKEMRYGPIRPIRPGDLRRSLRFLRSRPDDRTGLGVVGAAVYDPSRPPKGVRSSASPAGICGDPYYPPPVKTYVATPADRQRDWYVVDAEGQTLGRLATRIADALRGKRKPEYTPHIDTGDFIVVINAEKIRVTGNKLSQKTYWRHSGYPGGIKSRTLAEMLDRRPEEVIRKAVKGMLPRNRLARQQLTKLKVYAGPDHPHAAQMPKPMELESR